VECGLILDKNRGLFTKWRGFLDFGFIFKRENTWTRSMAHGRRRRLSMVDQGQGLNGGSQM
jgi:hypothetical protein